MNVVNQISNIINRKNNNNIIKIRLGKIYNNTFSYKINLRSFENILQKIKNNNNHHHINYKNYNKYYDTDKIYIIDTNGNEDYYKYININSNVFSLNDIDLQTEITACQRLSKDSFELKYKYDKIINVESIYFDYTNFAIEFTKNIDDSVYYKITFIINDRNAKINNILKLL